VTLGAGPFPSAIVLAGGLGTRLRAAVPDRPKPLAPVAGRPFVTHLLDDLEDAGVREAVLCVSHMADAVKAALGDRYRSIRLAYSREATPLGTGGAIRQALPQASSGTVLVANGDSLFRTDLRAFWEWHVARGLHASLLLARVEDAGRFGRVAFDNLGRITEFAEKDGVREPGWINAGLYLLDRSRILSIPPGQPISLEKEVFPRWIPLGLHGRTSEGLFMDIGTPESYRQAELALTPKGPGSRA
jgi:NDP-sugar pyrophosphorylase family protein